MRIPKIEFKRKNLLIIVPKYPPTPTGGAARSAQQMAEKFSKKNKVYVFCFDGKRDSQETHGNIKVFRYKKTKIKPETIFINLKIFSLRRFVKKLKIDHILVFNGFPIPGAFMIKRNSKILAILNTFYPLLPLNYSPDYLIEKKKKLTFFDVFIQTYKFFRDPSKIAKPFIILIYTLWNKLIIWPTIKKVDKYLVYHESIAEIYSKFGLNKKKFLLWAMPKEKLINVKKRSPMKGRFLFVGSLNIQKGVYILVNAMRYLKRKNNRIILIMAGDGEEFENIKRIVKKEKLNMVLLGRIDRKKLTKEYSKCQAVISSSLWPETFSRVWKECIENKIPLICSDTYTSRRILRNKAIFYERENEKQLAKIMLKLYKKDKFGLLHS